MTFNQKELALLREWLEDPTFVSWAQQSDKDHIAKWEAHFNLYPDQWELAKIARSLIVGIAFQKIVPNRAEDERALADLMQKLERTPPKTDLHPAAARTGRRRFWRVAAALALLIVASSAIYFQFVHNPQIVLRTDYGKQLRTVLEDSSVVTLNANSSLKYYKQNPRKVWLNGEAFFEVKKRPETGAEFRVLTSDLEVTVLGTSFNVNTRNDQTKVFLEEGSVRLDMTSSEKDTVQMHPGDLITFSKKNDSLSEIRESATSLKMASWKDGALMFDDTPLLEALFEIEDIYGIQFVLQTDELQQEKISGGVPIKDLEVTLETLRDVYGIQLRAAGKRYFISGIEEE